ncbi:MAG TPA: alkaline phosphatase family protein [bacterium]|nr:alkaline phosphatase family protein [bacterium]
MKLKSPYFWLFSLIFATFSLAQGQEATGLNRVKHIIVIYQENWSFDGLYGNFPGAEGFTSKDFHSNQVDKNGKPLKHLPQPILSMDKKTKLPIYDQRFPSALKVKPFDLQKYIKDTDKTGDLVHRYYQEQEQIDNGKMDKFVAISDNGGLVLSYFDATNLPEGQLAQEYTLCDHYFHGAFGGSFLNHIYFIAADFPVWKEAPASVRAQLDEKGNLIKDGMVTPDGYVVNTAQSVNLPHDPNTPADQLVPAQILPTIGDRLSDKKVTWAWYAEGFNEAIAGKADDDYEYHHQPFIYFKKYASPTSVDHHHLKDEKDFLNDLKSNQLPAVSWIKALGQHDEHPGYSDIAEGQQYVASLVKAIQDSPYWKDTVVLITYDEHGGRFDHVAPPVRDSLGPGSRVPLIVISPFAKKHFIDKTVYDSTSILKLIETRWNLKPLNDRDKNAATISNAFDFNQSN